MKILLIGNSHAAAVKLAWNRIAAQYPDKEITFFAARGKLLSGLRVIESETGTRVLAPSEDGDKLHSMLRFTSGGQDRISFDGYDLCILHGLIFPPRFDRRVSTTVRQALFRRAVNSSMAKGVFAKIRACSDLPVWISPQPLLRLREGEIIYGLQNYAKYVEVLAELEAEFGRKDVTFLEQPSETRESEVTTLPHFSVGSRRLDVGDGSSNKLHSLDDVEHMNDTYGETVLADFFQRIERSGIGQI